VRDTKDAGAANALEAGRRFYLKHFFLADGTPCYYSNAVWPVDIHSAAGAIDALSALGSDHPDALDVATAVLGWTLGQMKNSRTGRFYFQKHRLYVQKTPFLRWGDAWMVKAIGSYLSVQKSGVRDAAYAAP